MRYLLINIFLIFFPVVPVDDIITLKLKSRKHLARRLDLFEFDWQRYAIFTFNVFFQKSFFLMNCTFYFQYICIQKQKKSSIHGKFHSFST